MNFTPIETRILDRIQRDFPSTVSPLSDMATELGISEKGFLESLQKLKSAGVVRNISGIFNASRLGFVSSLIAFVVDEKNIDRAAAEINAHPGVSHNYLRDNRYNIWFTLASETDEKIEKTIKVLAKRCLATDYIILRNEKLIKVGLMLPVGDSKASEDDFIASTSEDEMPDYGAPAPVFSDDEREAIRLLQMDLPIERDPFTIMTKTAGSYLDADRLVRQMIHFKKEHILKRYSGVLRHREAGYRSNAMTVWKPGKAVNMKQITEVFSRERAISHLYIRSVYPGRWEYPLFAMIHARSGDELNSLIDRLARESGIADFQVLRSLRELKKERVVYFSEQFYEWERQAGL